MAATARRIIPNIIYSSLLAANNLSKPFGRGKSG